MQNYKKQKRNVSLVQMPKSDKKSRASDTIARNLPTCPICKSNQGYEISGFFTLEFKCVSCKAAWVSKDLPDRLQKMKMTQPPSNLVGVELVGLESKVGDWKDFDAQYKIIQDTWKKRKQKQLFSRTTSEKGEQVIWTWQGLRTTIGIDSNGDLELQGIPGELFLTTERLVWFERGLFSFGIPLEDLDAIAVAQTDKIGGVFGSRATGLSVKSTKQNVDILIQLWVWFGPKYKLEMAKSPLGFGPVRKMIDTAIKDKRTRIEKAQMKEKVQIILDFSSLKQIMKKGGLVMTTFRCPSCGASLDFPKTGKVIVCKYCDVPIKPVDIFEKIRSLIE